MIVSFEISFANVTVLMEEGCEQNSANWLATSSYFRTDRSLAADSPT